MRRLNYILVILAILSVSVFHLHPQMLLTGVGGSRASGVSAIPVDFYIDFENGADTDMVTVANATAGAHPASLPGTFQLSRDPLQGSRISTLGSFALGGVVSVGGVTYSNPTSTKGFQYTHSVGDEHVNLVFTAAPQISIWFPFKCTLDPATSFSHSLMTLKSLGGVFAIFNLTTNATANILVGMETGVGGATNLICHAKSGTQYYISMLYDSTNLLSKIALYESNLTEIGTPMQEALSVGATGAIELDIGQNAGHGDNPAGRYTYFDSIIGSWSNGATLLTPFTNPTQPFTERRGNVASTNAVALSNVVAGDLIVFAAKWTPSTAGAMTVTDGTTPLTVSSTLNCGGADGRCVQFAWLLSANAGNMTYTATFPAGATSITTDVLEINPNGGTPVLDVDGAAASGTSGTTATSATISTSANSLVVARFFDFTNPVLASPSIASSHAIGEQGPNFSHMTAFSSFAAAKTNINATATVTNNDHWVANIVSFKQ